MRMNNKNVSQKSFAGLAIAASAVLVLGMTISCGKRAQQVAPAKQQNNTEADLNSRGGDSNQGQQSTACTRTSCPTVDIQLQLSGPMSQKVNGFIGEAKEPVKWAVQVVSSDKSRVFAIYRAPIDIHGYTTQNIAGLEQAGQQQGGQDQTVIGNQNSPTTTNNTQAVPQNQSAIQINWPNPPSSEGKLNFVVRDITQCMARQAQGAQALCNSISDDKNLFERTIEVPFKVAKGLISQSRDEEGSAWGQLAGCLVLGFAKTSGALDSGTSQVLGGLIQGVSGNKGGNCRGTATTEESSEYGTTDSNTAAFQSQ